MCQGPALFFGRPGGHPGRPPLLPPMVSRHAKRETGQTSEEVCPWNVTFARDVRDGSPFGARDVVEGKDAATLARDLLALDDDAFRAAFSKSPMKRAKLAGVQRNARVVLGNAGSRARMDRECLDAGIGRSQDDVVGTT